MSSGFEMGLGAQPTQPPHSLLEIGTSTVSAYQTIYGHPDISGFIEILWVMTSH